MPLPQGTATSGGCILFGMFLYWLEMRQVMVYILDVAILVCMAVQLGVQFPYPAIIADNFDFITNGSLAVITLVGAAGVANVANVGVTGLVGHHQKMGFSRQLHDWNLIRVSQ